MDSLDARDRPRISIEPGARFVRGVPFALRQIGCMWLEHGDERCRCGRKATWTMGSDLCLARFYCERHGQVLHQRRHLHLEQQRGRRMRRLARLSQWKDWPQASR